MKKLNFLFFIFLSLFIFSATAFADSTYVSTNDEEVVLELPTVSAKAYILADAKTGEVILSKNENDRMPIASTTKIMTCLVALENSSLDEVVNVTSESCGIEGSSIYLYDGETITVGDLLYAIMLESANDAAVCLANHISGSVDAFSDLMNKRAETLNIKNTHFNNPHGLEDAEHYSTAYDMSVIWCEAMKNDNFRQIVSTKTYRINSTSEDGYRFLANHNKLLKTYDSCIGGKTGYTKNAGRCLISGASKDGAELVMVTLNDPNDWVDHETLLTYALSQYSTVDVAVRDAIEYVLPVVGSDQKQIVLKNKNDLSLTLRDVSALKTQLQAPRFVYAPITDTNIPLAQIVYSVEGKEIATLPLYPQDTVANKKVNFFERIFKFK